MTELAKSYRLVIGYFRYFSVLLPFFFASFFLSVNTRLLHIGVLAMCRILFLTLCVFMCLFIIYLLRVHLVKPLSILYARLQGSDCLLFVCNLSLLDNVNIHHCQYTPLKNSHPNPFV